MKIQYFMYTGFFRWELIKEQVHTFNQVKLLEQHFSEMFARTRHLIALMEDKESAEVIVSQLLTLYQERWVGRPFTNLLDFRHHNLKIDQKERQKLTPH
ncbi:hypothetical protein PR048_023435 [Dryococelus australis]|uniref:Uncharacterized protein n=1 Tax=Dryococelus australis TaxID=614101 RepID=A0ABQ9GU35_9NEOP|nr:hypothetical protein PR048_023435 [Dryococelus australis]